MTFHNHHIPLAPHFVICEPGQWHSTLKPNLASQALLLIYPGRLDKILVYAFQCLKNIRIAVFGQSHLAYSGSLIHQFQLSFLESVIHSVFLSECIPYSIYCLTSYISFTSKSAIEFTRFGKEIHAKKNFSNFSCIGNKPLIKYIESPKLPILLILVVFLFLH